MLNRVKYNFLFLIVTTIIACKEIPKENKVEPIETPLIPMEYFEDAIVGNLETIDKKVALPAAYSLHKALYRLNEIDTVTFNDFQDYHEFTWVKEISAKQKVVVLGMEYEDNMFELLLLNQNENAAWELKAYERIDTRFLIEASDVQYDSINNLLHLVVEQTWSSNGDLDFELFYQITADTLLQVLERNASGGQELEMAVHIEDNCNLDVVVNFNSEVEKLSKNKLQFLYKYEMLLYSTCDGPKEIKDTILKGSERITYVYNLEKGLYVPNWNSLEKLNKDQFEAITDWGDLDPFALEVSEYCQKIERSMPESSKLLKTAF
jgi:hypothetical protein